MTGLGSNGLGLGGTAGAGSVSPSVMQMLMGGGAPGAGGAVSPMMQPQTPIGMPPGGFPSGIRPQPAPGPAAPTGAPGPPAGLSGFLGNVAGSPGIDPQSQMATTLMSPFMAQLAQAGGQGMPTYDNGLSSLLATLGQGQNGLAAPGAQGINPLMMMLQQYLSGGGGAGGGQVGGGGLGGGQGIGNQGSTGSPGNQEPAGTGTLW